MQYAFQNIAQVPQKLLLIAKNFCPADGTIVQCLKPIWECKTISVQLDFLDARQLVRITQSNCTVICTLLVPQKTGGILCLLVSLEEIVLLNNLSNLALLYSKVEAIVFKLNSGTWFLKRRK